MTKKIEVRTSQNVILQYSLAGVGDRVLAFILDLGVIIILAAIGISIIGLNYAPIILFPALMSYHLLFETLNKGQSLGKKILGIRVIHLSGKSADLKSSLIRWVMRLLDVTMTFGTLSIFSISGSKYAQRIGDILAETTVVKITKNNFVELSHLQHLNQMEHEVSYEKVIQYKEEDIIYLKELLERYAKNPTETRSLVLETVKKLKLQLGLTKQVNAIEFIRTLIRDYVYLTR